MFLDLLNSLKVAAMATKPEGCGPGEGQLIFQCRNKITLRKRTDGNIELSWRGKLDRIPSEQKTKAERVPICSTGHIINTALDILNIKNTPPNVFKPGDVGHVKISEPRPGEVIIDQDLLDSMNAFVCGFGKGK